MRLTKIILIFICLATGTLFFTACNYSGNSSKARPKYIPDLGEIKADIELIRFESALAEIDTTNISQAIDKLKEKYGDFAKTYVELIICEGNKTDLELRFKNFIAIPEVRQLIDSVELTFPDLKMTELAIEEMMAYKMYWFGNKVYPFDKVYTFVSLYKQGAFAFDDYAGLGLDFFLGENHIAYGGIEALRHQYLRRRLNKDHLVSTLVDYIVENFISDNIEMAGNKMVDFMLYEGKKFYVKASLMPTAADSVIYNFSNFQVQYCQRGEAALWEHLGKESLLYSSDLSKFRKYVEMGPFNPEYELPGNSASWLGAQIVMQNADRIRKELKSANPDKSVRDIDQMVMKQVLQETDAQKFIQKYRPMK